MPESSNIATDRRVALLQRLVAAKQDYIEPESNLASPLGYSYRLAQELFDSRPGEEIKQLDYLADLGYLARQFFDKIHLCVCERRQFALNFRETCPRCGSSHIDLTDMIHHYSCGYTGAEPEFQDGIRYVCPKCDEDLKHIGVDYEKVSTNYVCTPCGNVFTDPDVHCRCLACDQNFPVDRAYVRTLFVYRLTPKGSLVAARGVLDPASSAGALIDSELNVYSFAYFEERLAQEFAGAVRYKRALSVVAAAIDRLEEFELTHGRQACALKLKAFAAMAKESLRDSDVAAVYDQTVMLLLLTDTPEAGAAVVAERLRHGAGRLNAEGESPQLGISASYAALQASTSGPQALFDDVMERFRAGRRAGGDHVLPAAPMGRK